MSIAFAEQLKQLRKQFEGQELRIAKAEGRLTTLETDAHTEVEPPKVIIQPESGPGDTGTAQEESPREEDDGQGATLSHRLQRAASKRR